MFRNRVSFLTVALVGSTLINGLSHGSSLDEQLVAAVKKKDFATAEELICKGTFKPLLEVIRLENSPFQGSDKETDRWLQKASLVVGLLAAPPPYLDDTMDPPLTPERCGELWGEAETHIKEKELKASRSIPPSSAGVIHVLIEDCAIFDSPATADAILTEYRKDTNGKRNNVDRLGRQFRRSGKLVYLAKGTHVVPTGKMTGNYSLVTVAGLPGEWVVARQAIRDATILTPPSETEHPVPDTTGHGVSFRLMEKSMAFGSIAVHKALWVAAMNKIPEFKNMLVAAVADGSVVLLSAGDEVRLTGTATGIATEVTLPGRDGKWWIPNEALKKAGVPAVPVDVEHYFREKNSRR